MRVEDMHPDNGTETRYIDGQVTEFKRFRHGELIEHYTIVGNQKNYILSNSMKPAQTRAAN